MRRPEVDPATNRQCNGSYTDQHTSIGHKLWLSLLAPIFVISPLSILSLGQLKRLPKSAQSVILLYALSQQLPALFTSDPLEASLLAFLRTALIAGLIGVGVALKDSAAIMPVSIGLVLASVVAFAFSFSNGIAGFPGKLTHPYMTSVSIGLAGTILLILSLFGCGPRLWRIFLSLLGIAVLILSGSRGALLAAFSGIVMGLIISKGWYGNIKKMIFISIGIVSVITLSGLSFDSLVQLDTTGRDLVWLSTISAFQSAPITGVGSYLLGNYLQIPSMSCQIHVVSDIVYECPRWLRSIGSPWLIAHNAVLQQLSETGALGLAGFFLIIGSVTVKACSSRDYLACAVFTALILATANDNTIMVPSPFFAEIFWILAGVQLSRMESNYLSHGLCGGIIMVAIAFPIIYSLLDPSRPDLKNALKFFYAPLRTESARGYSVYSSWILPKGSYRAVLQSCLNSCATVKVKDLQIMGNGAESLEMKTDIRDTPRQKMLILIYPKKSGFKFTPMATYSWTVEIKR